MPLQIVMHEVINESLLIDGIYTEVEIGTAYVIPTTADSESNFSLHNSLDDFGFSLEESWRVGSTEYDFAYVLVTLPNDILDLPKLSKVLQNHNKNERENTMQTALFSAETNTTPAETTKTEKPARAVWQIANAIQAELNRLGKACPYAAKPYLDAMKSLTSPNDSYGFDSGKGIILRFLGNSSALKGEKFLEMKNELRVLIGEKPIAPRPKKTKQA